MIEAVDLAYELKSVVDHFASDCTTAEVARGEAWDESWFDNSSFDAFIHGPECKCQLGLDGLLYTAFNQPLSSIPLVRLRQLTSIVSTRVLPAFNNIVHLLAVPQ